MKAVPTMLFIVATASAAFAQTVADDSPPPDVRILSRRWLDKSFAVLDVPRSDKGPLSFPSDLGPGPSRARRINAFVFEMKLANDGARDVRLIGWDYSSINPATQEEIASYHFFQRIKIRAHKEHTLTMPFPFLPAGIASANGSAAERVVLNCVVFSDKSEWRRNGFTGRCEPPRKR